MILVCLVATASILGAGAVGEWSTKAGHTVEFLTLPVSDDVPTDIVYDPNNGDLYYTSYLSFEVTVISAATGTVVDTIPVETNSQPILRFVGPESVTIAPDIHRVFVGMPVGIVAIDDQDQKVVQLIYGSFGAEGMVYDPVDQDLYASNGTNVSVIDAATGSVLEEISIGAENGQEVDPMAVDPLNGEILVGRWGPFGCSMIDSCTATSIDIIQPASNTVVGNITNGFSINGMSVDPNNGELYVDAEEFRAYQNPLSAIDVYDLSTHQLLASIPSDGGALDSEHNIAVDSSNGYLYFATAGTGDELTILDGSTNTLVGTVGTESMAVGVVWDPSNGDLYAALTYAEGISVVSPENTFQGAPEWQADALFGIAAPGLIGVVGALALLGDRKEVHRGIGGPRVLARAAGLCLLMTLAIVLYLLAIAPGSPVGCSPNCGEIGWDLSALFLVAGFLLYLTVALWNRAVEKSVG